MRKRGAAAAQCLVKDVGVGAQQQFAVEPRPAGRPVAGS
jgi:hypothetical protein